MNSKIFFEDLYKKILLQEVKDFCEFLSNKKGIISERIIDDYLQYLMNQLQKVCLRTLIMEMQVCKMDGKLKGKNEKEEYIYFCENYIDEKGFVKYLFFKYPVLKECVRDCIRFVREYYKNIVEYFEQDKDEINKKIFSKRPANKIIKVVNGLGDTHQRGKQVAQVYLDNGQKLIYKPHSMENEIFYHSILAELEEMTGIKQYYYSIVSYPEHSWCEFVEYESCMSIEQLKDYYRKLGVHLLATYLLGTKDLHCENIIAKGEYPIMVDLEVLIQNRNEEQEFSAEQMIERRVQESVLTSGLLPFCMWNREGNGIDVSGMGGKGGQVYPFKIPIVLNPCTSDMKISYEFPLTSTSNNLPTLGEKCFEVSKFVPEIMNGFKCAYEAIIDNKKNIERC